MVGKLKKTISFLMVCMILFMFSGCGTSKEYRVLCDEGVIAEKEYYRQGDEVTLVVYRDKGGEIELFADGGRIDLTAKEYGILLYLVRNKGIVLSREQILNEVWGYDYYGDDRTVDWQMKLLRGKLGKYRDCIHTIRGVGYKFET